MTVHRISVPELEEREADRDYDDERAKVDWERHQASVRLAAEPIDDALLMDETLGAFASAIVIALPLLLVATLVLYWWLSS